MSELHLGKGSTQPAKVEGLLRLYSMKFCPFSQRARLVLKAKSIDHDIVNINVNDKPEWYTNIHPEGKVPALDIGAKVVVESTDICDYLDETYPQVPLYSSDPKVKEQEKVLIKKIGDVVGVFSKCVFGTETKTPEEWLKDILDALDVFEKELTKKGTVFFGGDSPNMVDYMLWPWGERAACVAVVLKEKLPIKDDDIPNVRKWRKEMRKQPACDAIYNGPEKFWKCVEAKLKEEKIDYDSV
ncbi:unnamed protein product [Brassicogethes aeneus]|uniref:Uncharacterized protein n=1 Tax=Brassicogethes aeneus TaxID=1431903 RepID=A0A9P0FAN7_BRAAE|nr:unnamed protein product [Brassicogethes aeneus]